MAGFITRPAVNEVSPENILCQFLDTNGDGSGSIEMTGDYSMTADDFYVEAQAGEVLSIYEMLITVVDNANFTAAGYGGAAALTNGIHLSVHDDTGAEVLLLTPRYVKANYHWAAECYDAELVEFGAGDNAYIVRWTFARSGSPIVLEPGWSLRAELHDSFTALVSHTMKVNGTRQPK